MIKSNLIFKILFYILFSGAHLFSSDNISYKIDKLLEDTHEYAGYSMLALVSTNLYLGLNNRDGFSDADNKALHQDVGNILSSVAVTSALIGIYAHRDDLFDFSEGVTSDHVHAILGLTAVGLMLNNLEFDLQNHENSGILAGTLMFAAYAVTF